MRHLFKQLRQNPGIVCNVHGIMNNMLNLYYLGYYTLSLYTD